jgi:hypothetical protein
MRTEIKKGNTSNVMTVFIKHATTGQGLTGLAFNTASLVAYFYRPGAAAATAITLADLTALDDAFTSGGFKEISSANMPGWYRFDPPDTAFATGVEEVAVILKGATNMLDTAIEVDLVTNIAGELAADSVSSTSIADNAITADKIAADAITEAKIADDAIAAEHIAAGAIDADSIASNAYTHGHTRP